MQASEAPITFHACPGTPLGFVGTAFIAPGLMLLPDYLPHGTPAERQARVEKLFSGAFPGKRIVFIDAAGLNWYGGGLHCATLNEP